MRRDKPLAVVLWPVLAALFLALIAGATGCASEEGTGPPKISYGRDTCDFCHMIVSEARYAAAYRDADNKPFIFDDIEDMVLHAEQEGNTDAMTAWVHDYNTEEWLDAPDAWFVYSPEIPTPMAGGMVAFETQAAAEEFAGTVEGELLRWDDVLAHVAEGGDGGSTTEHGDH